MESPKETALQRPEDTSESREVRGLAVRCWGSRGSIPSPGPGTAGYGGNTSCLSVRVGHRRFIFDAGTGIRLLGSKLASLAKPVKATIFLSHFHWDHIQGFPFFQPIFDSGTSLEIMGPRQEGLDLEKIFAGQMSPVYFPIPFEAVAARLSFRHMNNDDSWEEDGVRIRSMRMRHPSYTVGYRLDASGRSVCYIPDNELVGGEYPVGEGWRDDLLEFVAGADVLFHDAMFTDEEYTERIGWGHSTYQQAIDLAAEAEVGQIFFFHHAPDRADATLNTILQEFRDKASSRGLKLEVNAAFEGKEIQIEEK